jgi:hypothetical protein
MEVEIINGRKTDINNQIIVVGHKGLALSIVRYIPNMLTVTRVNFRSCWIQPSRWKIHIMADKAYTT